jgi:hypothetical protein
MTKASGCGEMDRRHMRGSWEVSLIKKYHIQINNDCVKQKSTMRRATSLRGRCCEHVGKGCFMLFQPSQRVLQTAPGWGGTRLGGRSSDCAHAPAQDDRPQTPSSDLEAVVRLLGRTMCLVWTLLVFTIDIQAPTRSLTIRELLQRSILRRPPGRTLCRTAMGSPGRHKLAFPS